MPRVPAPSPPSDAWNVARGRAKIEHPVGFAGLQPASQETSGSSRWLPKCRLMTDQIFKIDLQFAPRPAAAGPSVPGSAGSKSRGGNMRGRSSADVRQSSAQQREHPARAAFFTPIRVILSSGLAAVQMPWSATWPIPAARHCATICAGEIDLVPRRANARAELRHTGRRVASRTSRRIASTVATDRMFISVPFAARMRQTEGTPSRGSTRKIAQQSAT